MWNCVRVSGGKSLHWFGMRRVRRHESVVIFKRCLRLSFRDSDEIFIVTI